jgi:hypothetical protein
VLALSGRDNPLRAALQSQGIQDAGSSQVWVATRSSCSSCPRCRAASWRLATRQVVGVRRASPSGSACDHRRQAEARLVLAGRALRVPRSTGIRRSLTDNNGRLPEALTCAIGVGSGPGRWDGRAFQAHNQQANDGPFPHCRKWRSACTVSQLAGLIEVKTLSSNLHSCRFTHGS